MYLLIAPEHLNIAYVDELSIRQARFKAASKAAFWIKVSDHPKHHKAKTRQDLIELYETNVMEIFFIMDISTRAPHNRRNK